jgi:uncharacterized repeat protein (TIGR01451 family)
MIQRALRLLPLVFVCSFASAAFAQANLTLDDVSFVQQLGSGSRFPVDTIYENSGPSPATDFKMTITIPAGLMYEGYSADPRFQCTEPPKGGQGDLVCTAANVGVVSREAIEAELQIDPAVTPGTVIPIQATLTSSNAVKLSQTISKPLTVIAPANLHLEMSAPASATAGDLFTTTITVTNAGPAAAVNAVLSFTHDPHVLISRLTGPAGWTCSSLCRTDSFAPGTATFAVTTNIPSNLTLPSLTEKASVFSVSDPDLSDDGATATIAVVALPHANLSLSVASDKSTVFPGEPVRQTYAVTNNGPDTASNLLLEIELPGSSFSSISSTFASCTTTMPLVCITPSLAVGATLTATVSFHAPPQAGPFETDAILSWSFSTTGPSTVFSNLQVIPPPASAELSAVVDGPPFATVGDLVTFTASVTNAGSLNASNVTVQQTLPAGLAFVSASDGCTGSPTVTCTTPLLKSGAWATFTITARALTAGTVTMTSTAATMSPEGNKANNSASATVVINAPAPPPRRRAARH